MNERRSPRFLAAALLAVMMPAAAPASADSPRLPFAVYTEANDAGNHYIPSGWMGDWSDIELKQDSTDSPRSGATCIEITYRVQRGQGADWAGIYWQDPANNWGTRAGGYDLSGAKKLVFWARGKKGGEKIDEFRIGGIPGEFFDSDVAYTEAVVLTPEWRRYEIDLAGKDLTSIKGGFMWAAKHEDNKENITFYLDDIVYE